MDVIIVDPWMLWGKDKDIMVDLGELESECGLGGRYHG